MLKCLKLFQNIGSISKPIFPRRERGFTFDFSIRILSFGKDQKNVVPRLYRSQDGVLKTSIVSLRVRSAAMKMASDKSSRVPFSPSFKEHFPWKNSQTLLARGTLCGAAATTTRVLTAKGSKLVLNHPPIVLLKSPHSIKSIVISHWRCGTNSFKHCFLSDFSSLQKIFGTLWILLETFDSSLIYSWSIIEK